MLQFSFTGQKAIVTGGTRGIGRAITESFLRAGATVIAVYATNKKAAEELRLQLQNENTELASRLDVQQCDVSKADAVKKLFEYVDSTHGSFEILVNNSGIRKDAILAMMSDEDWSEVLNTNLTGTFLMSKQAILRLMVNRYGRIVNVGSIGGEIGLPGQSNYAASKAGQVALSRTLSKEVAKRGITVNTVCPGFIETDLLSSVSEELRKQYLQQVPLRRFGSPEDVANAVLFLASKEAAYITGTTLTVAGGL